MTTATVERPSAPQEPNPGSQESAPPSAYAPASFSSGTAGWLSAVRWDRVVGSLALLGTFVLIVLSLLPAESSVLGPAPVEGERPASILGPPAAEGAPVDDGA